MKFEKLYIINDRFQALRQELIDNVNCIDRQARLEELRNAHKQNQVGQKNKKPFQIENAVRLVSNQSEFDHLLSEKHHYRNIIILVNLMWDNEENELFLGYHCAREILIQENVQKPFNLHFLSNLPRAILYQQAKSAEKVFPKSFQHQLISSKEIGEVKVPHLSHRKFDYLRKYAVTESGILDTLVHDVDSNKALSGQEIEYVMDRLSNYADILGTKVRNIAKELTLENFNRYQPTLHGALLEKRHELGGNNEEIGVDPNNVADELWKPLMVLVEDDPEQNDRLSQVLAPYFRVQSYFSGAEALDYITENSASISVLFTDMELLNEDMLDEKVQGIDLIEFVKANYPYIVVRVASYLPRNGLRLLLGDLLPVRNIALKHHLLESYDAYVADLVSDIIKDIDVKKQFQRLRGPNNSLWGSYARQVGQKPGRLKQFYYELKANNPQEFKQMWEDVDQELKDVLAEAKQIVSKFPSTAKTKEIPSMPLQKASAYLKELLLNRLFWIEMTYLGPKADVDFDDYRHYFGTDFKLYSTDAKRYNQYGILTGFSIRQKNFIHEIHFGQLFEEELARLKNSDRKMDLEFDLSNSYLLDTVYDILDIIQRANVKAFSKDKYPKPEELWEESNDDKRIKMIEGVFHQISKESAEVRQLESRNSVREHIDELMQSSEFGYVPHKTKNAITRAGDNINDLLE